VVDAATSHEWETAQRSFARLLGRGDVGQIRLAEQRLEETHEKLTGAAGTDAGLIRTALEVGWAGRLLDFLEENPDTEADLQTLVQEVQAALPAETVHASHHAISANGATSTATAQGPGPQDLGALAAQSELAYSTGQAGDAAGARDQFAALLPVRERVYGPEHAETQAVWHQLAHWTALARDAATVQD
jgi:hypothetical protein